MPDDRFALRVPPFTRSWSLAGQPLNVTDEADLILVRHNSLWASLIAHAQMLGEIAHPEWRGYTWANHVGVSRRMPDGTMAVSEMGPRGYERRSVAEYVERDACVLHFDVSDELRANAVANDEAMSGIDYGWLSFLPDALAVFSHEDLAVTAQNHIVCSAHGTLVMMGLGLFPALVPTAVIPVHLTMWTDSRLPRPAGV